MITDPLSISAASPTPALDFAVVDTSRPYTSKRKDDAGEYSLTIEHTPSKNGALRHYLRVEQKKLVTSPTSGLDSYQTASVSVAISSPPFGFSAVDMTALYALIEDIVATATLARILNNES